MLHQQKETLESIAEILGKLYDLNAHGYYTAWLDWSGHTNGFYIKIIKGKWKKGKKEKIIYEALIFTKSSIWKDGFSGKTFVVPEFLSFIHSLMVQKHSAKIKVKKMLA